MRQIPEKRAYARHIKNLGDTLHSVEHFRYGTTNIAIVVLSDGSYHVGTSRTNPCDNYSKKLGHTISVGRALYSAVNNLTVGSIWDGDNAPSGRELGKQCQIIADKVYAQFTNN